jgi:DMSO/TMAO reductase YedYZ molybdopterin-dependent catalytic subunit
VLRALWLDVLDPAQPSQHRLGRAAFLGLVAGGASSLLWAGPVSRFLSPLTSAGSQLVGNLIPVGGWRIYTISGSMPIFDPSTWRLEIGGLVRRPRTLAYDELTALPQAKQVSTFHCVTGWTVHDVRWSGVRFQQLFDLVEPLRSATAVRFVSMERPYEDSLTLEQLRLPDAMLATGLDGQPLSRPHGAPARVILPEMYGYKGVKWLTRMELVAKQPRGYWEQHGYDQNGWVGHSNGYGN